MSIDASAVPPRLDRRSPNNGAGDALWFARLRRHLGWVLLAKLALLLALFFLFFSAAHRQHVDAARVSDRLQLKGTTP